MQFNRKLIVIAAMAAVVVSAVAFTDPPADDHQYKNLKILPKDITHEKLDKVMHEFNDALGVKCNFCHAPSKDPAERRPDFASDDKPEKNITRMMMKMTVKINKKFFESKHAAIGEPGLSVTCATCHRGSPHPEAQPAGEKENQGPPPPPKPERN